LRIEIIWNIHDGRSTTGACPGVLLFTTGIPFDIHDHDRAMHGVPAMLHPTSGQHSDHVWCAGDYILRFAVRARHISAAGVRNSNRSDV
jgi:hypothetical protein